MRYFRNGLQHHPTTVPHILGPHAESDVGLHICRDLELSRGEFWDALCLHAADGSSDQEALQESRGSGEFVLDVVGRLDYHVRTRSLYDESSDSGGR
jgi:hypothetical protein